MCKLKSRLRTAAYYTLMLLTGTALLGAKCCTITPQAILIGKTDNGVWLERQVARDYAPLSVSNDTTVNEVVYGFSSVAEYSYKIGHNLTTDCSDQNGYTSWVPRSAALTADLSIFPDGTPLVLCLVGRGSSCGVFMQQEYTNASAFRWIKDASVDTDPPSPFLITGPNGTVTTRTPEITWENSEDAVRYDIAVSTNPDCSFPVQELSVPAINGLSQFTAALPDGEYFICIKSYDEVGNGTIAQNNGTPFTVEWAEEPQRHYIFATSLALSITSGTGVPPTLPQFGGLDAADWVCNYSAYQAGRLPNWDQQEITWKALLSSSVSFAIYRAPLEGPVYNLNNDLVAEDLWSSNHLSPVKYNEYGIELSPGWRVWTGTTTSGVAGLDHCLDWTDPVATAGRIGDPHSINTGWMARSLRECDGTAGLYCVSPLTDPKEITDPRLPGPFRILAPDKIHSNSEPVIRWQKSSGADYYDVTIAAQPDCSAPFLQYQTANLDQELEALVEGTLFVCITAHNDFGSTKALNMGRGLIIDQTPPAPFSITAPLGALNTTRPYVRWELSLDAASYRIRISSTPDCSTVVQEAIASGTDTEFQIETPLDNGNYFLCVSAIDEAGNSIDANNNALPFSVFPHHKIFVTSLAVSITSDSGVPPTLPQIGGLDAADWACNYAASQAGLIQNWDVQSITWKAILSTTQLDAIDRVLITGPVYNLNNEMIAANAADLWDGALLSAIKYDEFGSITPPNWRAWTGTTTSGAAGLDHCIDWSDPGSTAGRVGDAHRTNTGWIAASLRECNSTAALYCVSPVFSD